MPEQKPSPNSKPSESEHSKKSETPSSEKLTPEEWDRVAAGVKQFQQGLEPFQPREPKTPEEEAFRRLD